MTEQPADDVYGNDPLKRLQLLLNAIEYHRVEFKAPLPAGLEDSIKRAAAPIFPTERTSAPAPGDETYYTKGRDAEHFEKLDNAAFADAINRAAMDIVDCDFGPIEQWMPITAMLSGAAGRIKAALQDPQPRVWDQERLRVLVDEVWKHATESAAVPATSTADHLIARADAAPLASEIAGETDRG